MATGWPNSYISYPYSGIATGYIVHPAHISDLYDELSGVEQTIGLNPTGSYGTIKDRITAIETGYAPLISTGTIRIESSSPNGTNGVQLVATQGRLDFYAQEYITIGGGGPTRFQQNIIPTISGNVMLGIPTFPFSGVCIVSSGGVPWRIGVDDGGSLYTY